MRGFIRKQFYITKDQDSLLKSKARELGIKEAELVREALDHQIGKIKYLREPLKTWQQECIFIQGLMKERAATSAARTWKREELYDR